MRTLFYSSVLPPVPGSHQTKMKYYSLHIGNGVILYFSSERKARNEIAKINRELSELLNELAELNCILYRYFRFSSFKNVSDRKNLSQLFVNVDFCFLHLENEFMKQVYLFKNLYNLTSYLNKVSEILLQETKNVQMTWIVNRLVIILSGLKDYRRGCEFDLFNRGGE